MSENTSTSSPSSTGEPASTERRSPLALINKVLLLALIVLALVLYFRSVNDHTESLDIEAPKSEAVQSEPSMISGPLQSEPAAAPSEQTDEPAAEPAPREAMSVSGEEPAETPAMAEPTESPAEPMLTEEEALLRIQEVLAPETLPQSGAQ